MSIHRRSLLAGASALAALPGFDAETIQAVMDAAQGEKNRAAAAATPTEEEGKTDA